MFKVKVTTEVKVSYKWEFLKTFLQKANRLKWDYDADCYILIRRNGRFYTYISIDKPLWPLNL